LKSNPENIKTKFKICEILSRLERYNLALKIAQELLNINQNNEETMKL